MGHKTDKRPSGQNDLYTFQRNGKVLIIVYFVRQKALRKKWGKGS